MAITIKKGSITIKKPSVEPTPAASDSAPASQGDVEPVQQETVNEPSQVAAGTPVSQSAKSPHLVSIICGGIAICFFIALIVLQLIENSGYRGYFPLSMPPAPQLSPSTTPLPTISPTEPTDQPAEVDSTLKNQTNIPSASSETTTNASSTSTNTAETKE